MWYGRFLSGVGITSEARNLLLLTLERPLRKQQIPHGLKAVRDDQLKSSDTAYVTVNKLSWSWLAACQPARRLGAVDHVHVSVEVSGVLGGQKREERGDLFRLGVPAKRDLLVHRLQHFVGVLGALHWGQNISGCDGVHPHLGRQLQRHGAR